MVEPDRQKPEQKNIGKETRICVPVVGSSMAEFMRNMRNAQGLSNLIELRVDYIEGLKPQDVARIRDNVAHEAIFTCRRPEEDGKFKGPDEKRIAIIEEALQRGFD